MNVRGLCVLALVAVGSVARGETPAQPLDADACVAVAVRQSGQLGEAKGRITEWRGRLEEVRALYAPKLFGLSWLAPAYGVTGNGFDPNFQVDLSRWGPYLHFEGTFAKPLYSFGQIEAGEKAAKERLAVESARFDQARNAVALEVRKYYFLHLYARSLKPALDQVKKILDDALNEAQTQYEENTGKVTAVDLNKLRYAQSELNKAAVQQRVGEGLALSALKHTMGLPDDVRLELADAVLPQEPEAPLPDLATLIQIASANRPEAAQLKHGRAAAISFEEAQRMANRPVALIAGQLTFDYTPTRDRDNNPWHHDTYNRIVGGVALALRFNLDPWATKARGDSAHGLLEQVDGLARFAETGIPMEVRKAYETVNQAREVFSAASDGATAARKWMLFAAAGYVTGTTEARDLLEGVAAYVNARKGYFDSLLALHQARAELRYAIGDVPLVVPVMPQTQP
jgi:outer membrane protein TolC